jgi:hypothetical protein
MAAHAPTYPRTAAISMRGMKGFLRMVAAMCGSHSSGEPVMKMTGTGPSAATMVWTAPEPDLSAI